ncbi:MAG: DUF4338 domain-containing protein [Candidatus Brocadia sp.]|nr:DUF4338 domain-containing protein [Candidatus Brocadia sp.]
MACRGLLLKLEKLGLITLHREHSRRAQAYNSLLNRLVHPVQHRQSPVLASLKTLVPLPIGRVQKDEHKTLFHTLLALYHYPGSPRTAGENMKYIVFDRNANPLACILFGSPAWMVAPRDSFVGWDTLARKHYLHLIANNLRFLILSWVRIPHLASHIPGLIACRIRNDFVHKYGHPVYLLKTFVERERFQVACYKAANWQLVGQTKESTRNDRYNIIRVPIKDIYPLIPNFREALLGIPWMVAIIHRELIFNAQEYPGAATPQPKL